MDECWSQFENDVDISDICMQQLLSYKVEEKENIMANFISKPARTQNYSITGQSNTGPKISKHFCSGYFKLSSMPNVVHGSV